MSTSPWEIFPNASVELLDLKGRGLTEAQIAFELNEKYDDVFTPDSIGNKFRRLRNSLLESPEVTPEEISLMAEKLSKQNQRLQDINRIERKTVRNVVRFENFFEDYINELIRVIKENTFDFKVKTHKSSNEDLAGIVHLTDLHFNQLVSIVDNQFDFDIASKRLKYFADKIKVYFKAFGIKKVLVAATGDFINSDRRIDEMLNMATVRAQAVFVGVKLLQQFLLDLNEDFNVSFTGVTGNESRIQQELGFSNLAASDNFDWTIYNILKMNLDDKGIPILLDTPNECVVNINGQNILLIHGNNLPRNTSPEGKISEIVSRYNKLGVNIRFTLMGHFHECNIGSHHARGASLVGANGYSAYFLSYTSRASQNIHLINSNGNIDSIKIDLQTYPENSYDIDKMKDLYQVKGTKETKVNILKV